MVCFRYVIANTLHKSENNDDDDDITVTSDIMMMMIPYLGMISCSIVNSSVGDVCFYVAYFS